MSFESNGRPARWRRPRDEHKPNSGEWLGLILDSIPKAASLHQEMKSVPPLSPEEVERASEELGRIAGKVP